MNYAFEKLGQAIYELAVGEGDIKARFPSALRHISAITENDFPDELREDWRSIKQRLTNIKSNMCGTKYDEGQFAATLFRMHKKTASKIAVDIVNLHDRLEGYILDSE